jgi:hypothetical protein
MLDRETGLLSVPKDVRESTLHFLASSFFGRHGHNGVDIRFLFAYNSGGRCGAAGSEEN